MGVLEALMALGSIIGTIVSASTGGKSSPAAPPPPPPRPRPAFVAPAQFSASSPSTGSLAGALRMQPSDPGLRTEALKALSQDDLRRRFAPPPMSAGGAMMGR